MSILIIGASGYVGGEILHAGVKRGETVVGTYLKQSNPKLLRFDTANPDEELLESHDPIIWAAHDDVQSNNHDAIELCNRLQKRLIYISSDIVTFLDVINPNSNLGSYAKHKKQQEQVALSNPLSLVLRVGPVYGKSSSGQLDKRTTSLIERLHDGPVELFNNVYKTFGHVQELARSILNYSMDPEITGLHYLGPENRENYYDFYNRILPYLDAPITALNPMSASENELNKIGVIKDTSFEAQKKRINHLQMM